MPPRPATTTPGSARERLPTVPAELRYDAHHLIHLLDRQQPAECAPVSRLAAALPAGPRRPPLRGYVRWVREGGREELEEVCPSRASSARTRTCRATFSTLSAAFTHWSAATRSMSRV